MIRIPTRLAAAATGFAAMLSLAACHHPTVLKVVVLPGDSAAVNMAVFDSFVKGKEGDVAALDSTDSKPLRGPFDPKKPARDEMWRKYNLANKAVKPVAEFREGGRITWFSKQAFENEASSEWKLWAKQHDNVLGAVRFGTPVFSSDGKLAFAEISMDRSRSYEKWAYLLELTPEGYKVIDSYDIDSEFA